VALGCVGEFLEIFSGDSWVEQASVSIVLPTVNHP